MATHFGGASATTQPSPAASVAMGLEELRKGFVGSEPGQAGVGVSSLRGLDAPRMEPHPDERAAFGRIDGE